MFAKFTRRIFAFAGITLFGSVCYALWPTPAYLFTASGPITSVDTDITIDPLRFNGASKVVSLSGASQIYMYSPETTVPGNFSIRIFGKPANQITENWTLLSTIGSKSQMSNIPCEYDSARDTMPVGCFIRRIFTPVGTLVVDEAGYLHIFETVTVKLNAADTSSDPTQSIYQESRLVHIKSQQTIFASPTSLSWNYYIQPPQYARNPYAGTVTATYDGDTSYKGFHVAWLGAGEGGSSCNTLSADSACPTSTYTQPNNAAVFDSHADPYNSGGAYKTVALMYAFIKGGTGSTGDYKFFQQAPFVINQAEVVSYHAASALGSTAISNSCTNGNSSDDRITLLRFRKYPMILKRASGNLVIASVVNTEACAGRVNGTRCQSSCSPSPVYADRPSTLQPHVNVEFQTFTATRTSNGVNLSRTSRGAMGPFAEKQESEIQCARQFDLFDAVKDKTSSLVLFSINRTQDSLDTFTGLPAVCSQANWPATRENRLMALSSANVATTHITKTDNYLTAPRIGVFASGASGPNYWFLTPPIGDPLTIYNLADYYELANQSGTIVGSNKTTLAMPNGFRNTTFLQSVSTRTNPNIGTEGPLVLASAYTDPSLVKTTMAIDLRAPAAGFGTIDGVYSDAQGYYIWGWSCEKYNTAAQEVQLFAGNTVGATAYVGTYPLNQASEPAVNTLCGTTQGATGRSYRFKIYPPATDVYGVPLSDRLMWMNTVLQHDIYNPVLMNSGHFSFP